MTIYRGVSGVNREIKQQFRGVGGVNREIKEQYRGVGGVNRKVFNSFNGIIYENGSGKPLTLYSNNGTVTSTGGVLQVRYARGAGLTGSSYAEGFICTTEKIDLTAYTTLKANIVTYAESRLTMPALTTTIRTPSNWNGNWTNATHNGADTTWIAKDAELSGAINGTMTFDISNISGLYHVMLEFMCNGTYGSANPSHNVSKIWLE